MANNPELEEEYEKEIANMKACDDRLVSTIEQAIRPFTIGRKNWVIINSPAGASASAVLYSLIETAKANHVQLFEYFDYLLTELANHTNDKKRDFLQDLLPWSETVQEKFHLPLKKKS